MAIWQVRPVVDELNAFSKNTLSGHIGIEFLEIGDDFLKDRMPVDYRTIQPMGILHGGASVALAETLGSVAAALCENPSERHCVGLEINANHVRSVRSGFVYGVARPLHLGSSTQLWEIRITDGEDKLVCICRLTMAVLAASKQPVKRPEP